VRKFFKLFRLSAVLLLASSASGGIILNPEFSYSIPDSLSIRSSVSFVDLDNDGYDELLIQHRDYIARFSLQDQTTVDYFRLKQDTLSRRYGWTLLDHDSHLDFMETIVLPYDSGNTLIGIYWLSSDGYAGGDSIRLLDLPDPQSVHYLDEWQFEKLFFENDHGDTTVKLFGRFCHFMEECDIWYMYCETVPLYTLFEFTPGDSTANVVTRIAYNSTEDHNLYNDTDLQTVYFEHSEDDGCAHGRACWYYQCICLGIQQGSDLLFRKVFGTPVECRTDLAWVFGTAMLEGCGIADFLSSSPRFEMIMAVAYTAGAGTPWEDFCEYESKRLICYDLSTPGALPLVWEIDNPADIRTGPIFADHCYPQQFFMLAGRRLFLHNATDGSKIDSTVEISSDVGGFLAHLSIQHGGPEFVVFHRGQELRFYSLITATEEEDDEFPLPVSFALSPPFPNPFNTETNVLIKMPVAGKLKVEVFNVVGQRVDAIYDGPAAAGKLNLHWNAGGFASGVYLIRAKTNEATATVKAVLLK